MYFSKYSLQIKWTSIASPINIDVVKPITVLNSLLKSMNGGKEGCKRRDSFRCRQSVGQLPYFGLPKVFVGYCLLNYIPHIRSL